MARERLAAMRAQQQQQRSSSISGVGYPRSSLDSAGRTGDEGQRRVPEGGGERIEMEATPQQPPPYPFTPSGDTMSAFYSEIGTIQDDVRRLNENVGHISELHSRALDEADDVAAVRHDAGQLDHLVEETTTLTTGLKRRIARLQQQQQQRGGDRREGQIQKQQMGLVKRRFVEAIQNYQQVERQYRTKYRQRMERQFRIVKPDATPQEVMAVVSNDENAEQIFTQALQSSTRYGESRVAYREVQARQEDIRRIEMTLSELAQLFSDVSVFAEQQEETLEVIETTGVEVDRAAEAGLTQTKRAVHFAQMARRKRWICFFIILAIIGVVAVIVGIIVATQRHK